MKEELKRETEGDTMPNNAVYDVYKTATGLYVAEEVCQMFNVGDKKDYKTIRNHLCYKVDEQDIEYIEKQSSYQEIKLIPNIVTIFDLQLVLSFTVYIDRKHDNKLYVLNNLCTKYNIKALSKRMIEGTTYCNVTPADITAIEEATKKEKVILKRKYIVISLNDEIKPAEYLFIYYYDFESKKAYIRRDMYELATANGIKVQGEPRIISGKNCYSATESELKDIEIQLGYRGVEQLLRPAFRVDIPASETANETISEPEETSTQPQNTISVEELIKDALETPKLKGANKEYLGLSVEEIIKDKLLTPKLTQENERITVEELIKDKLETPKLKPRQEVVTVEDLIKDKLETPKLEKNMLYSSLSVEELIKDSLETPKLAQHKGITVEEIMENITKRAKENNIPKVEDIIKDKLETPKFFTGNLEAPAKDLVLIYQDKRTNDIYVPTDFVESKDEAAVTTIMHRECYITDVSDLADLQDKNVVIAPVFPVDKKVFDVLLCNNNGQLFVSKNILEELGFYIENPHRIIVNKEIFEEITEADVDLIEGKESDSCHINIIVKQIAPKRG